MAADDEAHTNPIHKRTFAYVGQPKKTDAYSIQDFFMSLSV